MNLVTKLRQLTKPSLKCKSFILNKRFLQSFQRTSNDHKILLEKFSLKTLRKIMTETKKYLVEEHLLESWRRNFHFCERNDNEGGNETKKGQTKTKNGSCSSDNADKGLPNLTIEPKCKIKVDKPRQECERKKPEEKNETKCVQPPEPKDDSGNKCKSPENNCESKCSKPPKPFEDANQRSTTSSCKPLESECASPTLESCKKSKCACRKKEVKSCEDAPCPNSKNKCAKICPSPDQRPKTTCYQQPCIVKKKPEACPPEKEKTFPKKDAKVCPTQRDKCEKKEPSCPKKGSGCPEKNDKAVKCPVPVKKRQEKGNVVKKHDEFDNKKKPKKTLCEDVAPPGDK